MDVNSCGERRDENRTRPVPLDGRLVDHFEPLPPGFTIREQLRRTGLDRAEGGSLPHLRGVNIHLLWRD